MSIGRWVSLLRWRRLDRELDEELRHHLEALEGEYLSRGLSVDEARRAARRDMGGIAQVREAHRDQRSIPALEILWRNIRFGLRSLRRTPGVTTAVLATLAIGIGANTAIFTIVYDVLLKPLPYPDAEQLVGVRHRSGAAAEEIPSAPYLYFTYRDESRTLEDVGLWRSGPATVTGLDRPEQVQALLVTHEILRILGVPPQVGRAFSAQDDTPGSTPTIVLAFGYWQRRFGGDASVIGRMVTVDGQRREIVGVLPQRFRFLDRPIDSLPVSTRSEQRDARALRLPEPGAPEARRATGGRVNGSRADCADRHRPIPPAGRLHARAVRSTADDAARPAAERRGGR